MKLIIQKKIRKVFPKSVGHPEGTHFWQKLKFDIFSKFLQHRVAYDQYNLKLFSAMLGHPEGRGRATPIFDKN